MDRFINSLKQHVSSESLKKYLPLSFFTDDIEELVQFLHNLVVQHNYKSAVLFTDQKLHSLKRLRQIIDKIEKFLLIDIVILSEGCQSDMSLINRVKEKAQKVDLVIALGSGTINDICKYVSYLAKVDYIVIPTAPSMNGYISSVASISEKGIKKSFLSRPPKAILVDIETIHKAPKNMLLAGVADHFARNTSRLDLMLSNYLFQDEGDYSWVHNFFGDIELNLLAKLADFSHDYEVTVLLMELLILDGFIMSIVGSSKLFSQGEHAIAHMITAKDNSILHGTAVGVSSVILENIQQYVLSNPVEMLPFLDNYISSNYSNNIKQKYVDINALLELEQRWINKKDKIIRNIEQNRTENTSCQEILKCLGCSYSYSDLGFNVIDMSHLCVQSIFLRERYGFLDFFIMAYPVKNLLPLFKA